MKIFLILCMVLLVLTGCGGQAREPEFVFRAGETEIAMNGDMEPILRALGEPRSCTEEPSCAFTGMDRTYYFGSFYIRTYPLEGKDYVRGLWFADDSVTTPEGIGLGSSRQDVETAYGRDGWNGSNAYVLTAGHSRLTILMERDTVSGIRYDSDIL